MSPSPLTDGMKVFLIVHDCGNYTSPDQLKGNVREYYIAAETEEWNYAPSGINAFDGKDLTDEDR